MRTSKSLARFLATASVIAVSQNASAVPTLLDPGFESPVQPANNWEQAGGAGGGSLAGANWTFSPSAGISRNVSAFQGGGVTAPEGQQLALIQTAGTITQAMSGFTPGQAYSITLSQRARAGQENDLRVLVDGQLVGGGRTLNAAFQDYTTSTFIATSATPTLTLQTLNPLGGDRTTFMDNVRINTIAPAATPTITNASFEDGVLNPGVGYGTVDGWASTSVNTGNNISAQPFLNGAAAPDGTRVAFLQNNVGLGTPTLSQTITGLTPGKQYQLIYNESGRTTSTSFHVATVDGNTVVPSHNVIQRSTGFATVHSLAFTATSTSAQLAVSNPNNTSDNTLLIDNFSIRELTGPNIADGGFENPVQPANNWEQANGAGGGSLVGSAWTITGGAGITRNISPFQNGGIPAPEGVQHGLIQNIGSFTQTISGFDTSAYYQFDLLAMARQGQNFGNDLEVILDLGLPTELYLLDIDEVTANKFTLLTSEEFIPQNSSYTLTVRTTFNGGLLTGDRTTFIDDLRFQRTRPIPEPATAGLAILAIAGLGLRRRHEA